MFWWDSEGDLGPDGAHSRSKADVLRGIVTDKLSTAAREILAVVERTVAEYEEEAAGFRQEIDRQKQALEVLLQSQVKTETADLCSDEQQLHPVGVKQEEEEAGGGENLEQDGHVWDDQQLFPESQRVPVEILIQEEENEEPRGKENPKQDQRVWSEQRANQLHPESQHVPTTAPGKIVEEHGGGESPEEDAHMSDGELENLGLIPCIEEDDDDHEGGEDLPPLRASQKQKNKRPRPPPRSGTRTSLRLRMNDSKELIQLSLCMLADPHITEVSPRELRACPTQEVSCPVGMQEEDFLDLLRFTFPQINNKPFDLFSTDDGLLWTNGGGAMTLLPLHVETLTAEEIQRKLKDTDQSVYIRLRGEVDSSNTAIPSRPVPSNKTKMRFVAQSRARTGVENGQSFIDLRFSVSDESDVEVTSPKQVKVVRCPLGLQEEDFLSQLRSLFPPLAGNRAFELFQTNSQRDLIPLNASRLTPEEIWKSVSAGGSGSTGCVQIKRKTSADEDGCVRLNTILLMDPYMTTCSKKVLKTCPSQVVQCPLGLQEEDFLSQLRSTFPQLGGDVPFELLSVCNNGTLMPLQMKRRTPEEIRRFMVSSGNKNTGLCVQLKTGDGAGLSTSKNKYLPFKIRLLEDPNITCLLQMRKHMVSPLMTFRCRADLDVLGFRRWLMKKFPLRLQSRPYDLVKCNFSTRLVPLRVEEESAARIYQDLRSTTLYVRFKELSVFNPKKSREKSADIIARGLRRSAALKLAEQQDEISWDDANDDGAVEWTRPPENGGDDGGDDTNEEKQQEDEKEDRSEQTEQTIHNNGRDVTADTTETKTDTETQSLARMSCKVCGIVRRKKNLLTKHAMRHVDNPWSMCGVCGTRLPSADALRTHLLGHQTIHACDACGKVFVTLDGLRKHAASHAGWRPHACPVCRKTFALEPAMRTHMRFHDGRKAAESDVCHKAFATESQLKRHSAAHSGARPYVALKSLTSLTTHMTSHSRRGTVDKTCKLCRRKFYSLAYLISHMETHKV